MIIFKRKYQRVHYHSLFRVDHPFPIGLIKKYIYVTRYEKKPTIC